MPIEGTWWSGDDRLAFDLHKPGGWSWTLAVPVPDTVRLVRRPAQRVAWLVHHEELPVAYVALLEHLRERGHEPRAPIVETYLNDPTVTEPQELVTRLAVAMDPAVGGGPD